MLLNVPRDVERLFNEQPFVFVYRIYESRLTDPDPNLRGNVIAGEPASLRPAVPSRKCKYGDGFFTLPEKIKDALSLQVFLFELIFFYLCSTTRRRTAPVIDP